MLLFAMTMWHRVCFHSFPLKKELEVERTHMTNDEKYTSVATLEKEN